MLYGLIDYDYDYHELIGYTEDLDEAYKYSAIKGYEIEPLERLESNIDYSQYKFVYHYGISFKFSNKTNKYERKDFPDDVPECDYCRCRLKILNYIILFLMTRDTLYALAFFLKKEILN